MKQIYLILLVLFTAISAQALSFDTLTTESGLRYFLLEKGAGPKAETGKYVEVHYTLKLTNGTTLESSRDGDPFDFIPGKGMVIKGWDEGIPLFYQGDKGVLIIPSELGYGSKGAGDLIPPNTTLVFEIEIMSVTEPKLSLVELLLPICSEGKTDEAIAKYKDIKENEFELYNFRESQLNFVGYKLMRLEKYSDAIKILEFNATEYPNSYAVYDALGDAYNRAGIKEDAIKNYKKSLELNRKNKNAIESIKKLEGKE